MDGPFPGDSSKDVHRNGDPSSSYRGYGENFNTFQVEINRNLRENHRERVIKAFAGIITEFNSVFQN